MLTSIGVIKDRTIPVPAACNCGAGNKICQRQISPEDRCIVRYMGRVFHLFCFKQWYAEREARQQCPACKRGEHGKHIRQFHASHGGKTVHKACLCKHEFCYRGND